MEIPATRSEALELVCEYLKENGYIIRAIIPEAPGMWIGNTYHGFIFKDWDKDLVVRIAKAGKNIESIRGTKVTDHPAFDLHNPNSLQNILAYIRG